MSARPTGGMDGAKGAVGEFDGEHGGVVGIQDVVVDAVAGGFGEGFEFGINRADRTGGERRKIDDVDADVAEHTAAAVPGREAPEPAGLGAPVAPDFAG